MDELLHHCLRELSFDGDLGCNASRLKDFVAGFYSQSGASGLQNPDDAFCSFVWSLVVQQPTVVVGLLPEGVTSEVWVAPQTSAKRKAKATGQEHVETTPARLEPITDAKIQPLEELVRLYGDRLRIAVEPDAIFAAVTGSHIRSSRMSPMVYTALQIITRGRDDGVTVVELGQKSKYDQKTCFYLVRQLTEMDLVAKVRRGGVGTHFCIHKYFYDRSPSWKAIREEESRSQEATRPKQEGDDVDDDDELSSIPSLDFTQIDSRHLSSLPLVKARVIKLLKASKNSIHASNNMLLTLGFTNPTKTDRRFFQSRIRELIQQGVIEKVLVPSNRKKSGSSSSVKCFRLVTEDGHNDMDGAVVVKTDDDKEDDLLSAEGGVKANITIHKQILDLLEETGTVGLTLNELSVALNNFDKRTIELLLSRAEKSQPPQHLADIGIAGLMETNGRERRHRYYTIAAYQKLVAAEKLDKSAAGYNEIDLSHCGEFLELKPSDFYEQGSELARFQDTFTRATKLGKVSKKQYKNPILADGTVKQGRPRKDQSNPAPAEKKTKGRKRKRSLEPEPDVQDDPQYQSKRTKAQNAAAIGEEDNQNQAGIDVAEDPAPVSQSASAAVPPRKRGRPPKRKAEAVAHPALTTAKRIRGRAGASAAGVDAAVDTELPLPEEHIPREIHPPPPTDPSPHLPTPTEPSESCEGQAEDVIATSAEEVAELPRPPEPLQSPPPASASTRSKGRVNVSHLRRENEILRVIEEAGGIVNIQTKEFYEAHIALLDSLTKIGEPTSAPVGTRTDKRTATLTIDSLERKGKVKQLKTSVATHTGLNKPATIVYLPQTQRESLNAFLASIARGSQPTASMSSVVKLDQPLEYGADPTASARGILPLQFLQLELPGDSKKEKWSKNAARANQLFGQDDSTIREILLTERTTVGQLYGFIVGKAARAREFHLSTLRLMENGPSSSYILPGSRIIDFQYFCNDIPTGAYTQFVSALSHSDPLTAFFRTEEGPRTPVKDLPQDLHTTLQVGRSRSRTRILDVLEFLRELQLVVPLKPSSSESAWITCDPHNNHPGAFDISTDTDWTTSTPHAAPTYWYFKAEAPVHLWHVSESEPPVWRTVPIGSSAAAQEYWGLLRSACTDTLSLDTIAGGISGNRVFNATIGRSLRRSASWNADYVLTWHQMKFLEKSIDIATGNTVLDETDENTKTSQLKRLSWVTSAPQTIVERYLQTASSRLHGEKEKIRSKDKEQRRLKRLEESRSSIAKKAEEAKMNKEREWSALLARIYPGDIIRVKSRLERVHHRFMLSGSTRDVSKWEKEVLDAIREAEVAATRLLRGSARRLGFRPNANGLPTVPDSASSLAPTIQALIDQQEPLLAQGLYKRRSKSKKRSAEEAVPESEKKPLRRHRFQWNKDYDELAQDASVIIRARCRNLPRLDWAALEQVFPAVLRNTVRQRLSTLREVPGNESYLRRLEDRWFELWLMHRGTDELPDDYPESPNDFDLIHHIEFLRRNVDKNALRVGFGQEKVAIINIVPDNIQQLLSEYTVVEELPVTTTWDFVWNSAVEEGREKRLLTQSIVQQVEPLPTPPPQDPDEVILAEAALKMVMGSPSESYDCDIASALLRNVGEELVSNATHKLLARGVLSKLQRDPQKQKPGRQLKISDNNQSSLGGSIPRETYQDANSLLESIHVVNDWRDWPLTATDGDAMALIQLVSDNQAQFTIDTSQARAARDALDWNSKRADDDQIETEILVKYTVDNISDACVIDQQEAAIDKDAMDTSLDAIHAVTEGGMPACCRKSSHSGVVDCVACLNEVRHSLHAQLAEEEKQVLAQLLSIVKGYGVNGCPKEAIKSLEIDDKLEVPPGIFQKILDGDIPLAHWVGYTSLKLVAAEFIKEWTVVVNEQPVVRVFPRRWLSIHGSKIADFWQAAQRAICALVVFRPGISQVSTIAEVVFESSPSLSRKSGGDQVEIADCIRSTRGTGVACFYAIRGVPSPPTPTFTGSRVGHAIG
ncbi:hypothetical protein FA15DRAFT_580399 [Coprinopsis marcescibilis]|uniref:Uncharacterized protein n=1 Tax=Coprinopsis marcescibilis TaxID=230819 RepID=A0A5C3LF25_COPMA|nr:hypothetical protein FA15DRAFT_580399 [Coprinopsis marcescibilis]